MLPKEGKQLQLVERVRKSNRYMCWELEYCYYWYFPCGQSCLDTPICVISHGALTLGEVGMNWPTPLLRCSVDSRTHALCQPPAKGSPMLTYLCSIPSVNVMFRDERTLLYIIQGLVDYTSGGTPRFFLCFLRSGC